MSNPDGSVMVHVRDGFVSDAVIRYDVAMKLALQADQQRDDVVVMARAWDAIEAAREMRDAGRLTLALAAMESANERYQRARSEAAQSK